MQACAASHYLNPVGGQDLYQKDTFAHAGIDLEFLHPHLPAYPQGNRETFTPGLSIIDALMYNEPQVVGELAKQGVVNRA
ncbi:WbqC-like protein family protein [compost metagenome]